MRAVLSPRPLPRKWEGNRRFRGLLLEKDLKIGSSRLRAKLLVFDSIKSLRVSWKTGVSSYDLGRSCRGAVNGLFREIISFKGGKERSFLEVDPRYFCVIGLVRGHLQSEIVCHEAVHAAFNYVKRIKRSPWDTMAREFDEEAICYPAGRIASEINDALYAARLYDR